MWEAAQQFLLDAVGVAPSQVLFSMPGGRLQRRFTFRHCK
jgi:hypothetical protein